MKDISLVPKILFLFIVAFALFFSNFFITEKGLGIYFFFIVLTALGLASLCCLVIGYKAFKPVVELWLIGVTIYLIFAIPRIYAHASLSPLLNLNKISDRWLYSLAYPARLLGTFSAGLVFAKITSPIEFLKFGKTGFKVALLFRAIQYATQSFSETRLALLMQDQWPEESKGLIRIREAWLTIRYGPTLIGTTLRNIIVWFPWAWLCFNKLQSNIKGGSK